MLSVASDPDVNELAVQALEAVLERCATRVDDEDLRQLTELKEIPKLTHEYAYYDDQYGDVYDRKLVFVLRPHVSELAKAELARRAKQG